jgi:hypothetical protein
MNIQPPRASFTPKANDDIVKSAEAPFSRSELIPSNWDLTAADDNAILAINSVTGRRFEGNRAEFSTLLRGQ